MKKALILLFFLVSVYARGQNVHTGQSFDLNNNWDRPSADYKARDVIYLREGFTANSNSGEYFRARIDDKIICDEEYETPIDPSNRPLDFSLTVGTTQSIVNVSPMGGATCQIPIFVSPGTAGMQPGLAIVYNSQTGSGLLGTGWNLSGLSVITRIGKTIYHDGEKTGITLTSQDPFVLDGQRLIKTGTVDNNGWQDEYRTEAESFTKIYMNGWDPQGNNPTSFTAKFKNGLTYEYGLSDDSKITAPGKDAVITWLVNKIYDRNGNYMTFHYRNEGNGEVLIDYIEYTANDNANLTAYNRVDFYYSKRQDVNEYYIAGSKFRQSYLLSMIKIKSEDETVRTYDFKFSISPQTTTYQSHLIEVLEYDEKDNSYNSTFFNYNGDYNLVFAKDPASISRTGLDDEDIIYYPGDFNGDGITDFLGLYYTYKNNNEDQAKFTGWSLFINNNSVSQSNGFHEYSMTLPACLKTGKNHDNSDYVPCSQAPFDIPDFRIMIADMNGDGMDDVIVGNKGTKNNTSGNDADYFYYRCYFSGGNSLPSVSSSISLDDNLDGNKYHVATIGDFDGDGISEFFGMNVASSDYFITSFNGRIDFWVDKSEPMTDEIIAASLTPIDYDGDGITELLYDYKEEESSSIINYKTDYIDVSIVQGVIQETTPFTFTNVTSYSSYNIDNPYAAEALPYKHIIDFNGDGLQDLLRVANNGTTTTYSVLLSNGRGSFTNQSFVNSGLFLLTLNGTDNKIFPQDINGDGKTDIVVFNTGTAYINTGSGFVAVGFDGAMTSAGFVWDSQTYFCFGDFNGDGIVDVGAKNRAWCCQDILTFGFSQKQGLLRSVVDGFNRKTEIEYDPFTKGGGFYSKADISLGNDVINFQGPIYAVSAITVPDGVGATSVNNYHYKGLYIHRKGRGVLGFQETSVSNITMGSNFVSRNYFETNYYTAFKNETQSFLNGNVIHASTSDFSLYEYGNKRIFLFPNKKTDEEINRDYSTEYTYNFATGNVESVKQYFDPAGDEYYVETLYDNYTEAGCWIASSPQEVTIKKKIGANEPEFITSEAYSYDNNGNLLSKTSFNGLPKAVTTSYSAYNDFGNPGRVEINAANEDTRWTEYKYDDKGRFIEESTDVLGTATQTYEPVYGNVISETGITGLTTSYEYGVFGRVEKTHTPQGHTVEQTIKWASSGNSLGALYYTESSAPGVPDIKIWYDILEREIKSETEGFNGIVYADKMYDNKGRLLKESLPHSGSQVVEWTEYQYDLFGRLKMETYKNLSTVYSYSGLTTTVTPPAGSAQASSKTTDEMGNVILSTDAGGTISYEYHSSGQPRSITSINSTVCVEYDEYGRQITLNDPDAGQIEYEYNAFGELIHQTDANQNEFFMEYDNLGRIDYKDGPDGRIDYTYYDSGDEIGLLESVSSPYGVSEYYHYDEYGRPIESTETVEGEVFTTMQEYDEYGNVVKSTYPSGFFINFEYNSNGFLNKVKRGDDGTMIYQPTQINSKGQLTHYLSGNGLETELGYDTYHRLATVQTPGVQDMEYDFDNVTGNLLSRYDKIKGMEDVFSYDDLNRLTNAFVSDHNAGISHVSTSVDYENNGNISSKSDAGDYSYIGIQPHAVNYIDNYTTNIPEIDQDIVYTSFNKVSEITEGDFEMTFLYGPGYDRKKTVLTNTSSNEQKVKYFAGNYEKEITDGNTKEIHYLPGGAVYITENGVGSMYYTYKDHLGSITTITDAQGTILEEQNFDAWGRRRNPAAWNDYAHIPAFTLLDRGYTGHEMLYEFGLINMNGRMYDPVLGRMLSPDDYVQMPGFTQSFNRYSYCFNNPLVFTDPYGENPLVVAAIIAGLVLTDAGYDIQKAVSPVAFHIDLALGKQNLGIGFDVSVGIPQAMPISYRYDFGATYYSYRIGGYGSGWQVRNGAEWGIGFGLIQYGGIRYRDYDKNGGLLVDQVVHTAQIGTPLINVSYSNDTEDSFPWANHVPFIPKLREGGGNLGHYGFGSDRYRTASGRLRIGLFELGFFLHTGEGNDLSVTSGTLHFSGGNIDDPNRSNGIIYVGFCGFKIGWDSENIRHVLQNRLAHDGLSGQPQYGWRYPWVLMTDRDPSFVFQFGNF